MKRFTFVRFPRVGMLAALLVCSMILGLIACSSEPKPGPVAFREVPRQENVYRVTAQWKGPWPADLQEQVLARCAEIAGREGARTFFIMSADFDITNTAYLKAGSPTPPVMVVPHEKTPAEVSDTTGLTFATVTMQIYPPGREPAGYRLYDVAKTEQAQRKGAAPDTGSVGFGVGVFSSSRSSGFGMGVGVRP